MLTMIITASISVALWNNTDGAKDKCLTELMRIMGEYQWCTEVDINLESGGEHENRAMANALFRNVYNTVKSYNPTKLANICLSGMTACRVLWAVRTDSRMGK